MAQTKTSVKDRGTKNTTSWKKACEAKTGEKEKKQTIANEDTRPQRDRSEEVHITRKYGSIEDKN